MTKIRKPYDKAEPENTEVTGESLTEQSHARSLDINNIINRAQKTGLVPSTEKEGHYGVAPSMSYHEAVNFVENAKGAFNDLPSQIRAKFGNDPEKLLQAIEVSATNELVKEELLELGVIGNNETHGTIIKDEKKTETKKEVQVDKKE